MRYWPITSASTWTSESKLNTKSTESFSSTASDRPSLTSKRAWSKELNRWRQASTHREARSTPTYWSHSGSRYGSTVHIPAQSRRLCQSGGRATRVATRWHANASQHCPSEMTTHPRGASSRTPRSNSTRSLRVRASKHLFVSSGYRNPNGSLDSFRYSFGDDGSIHPTLRSQLGPAGPRAQE